MWFKLKSFLELFKNNSSRLLKLIVKTLKIYKNEGLENLIKRIVTKYVRPLKRSSEDKCKSQLDCILRTNQSTKGIISYLYSIDWNTPLYQRPHHLAVHLSKLGYLFFY